MEFMVSASFRAQDQEEMFARVPQEQAHIQVLREQGTIEALYNSADHLLVWVVMRGESQDQVQKALEAFPLYQSGVGKQNLPNAEPMGLPGGAFCRLLDRRSAQGYGGGIFYCKQAMDVYAALSIRKERIHKRQAWENYSAGAFG
jgi:hypothetical protein